MMGQRLEDPPAPEFAEPGDFRVVLTEPGQRPIDVILAVREVAGLSAEARNSLLVSALTVVGFVLGEPL